jgi:tRNA G18 (ribose-2'-O)-methylase SpoU
MTLATTLEDDSFELSRASNLGDDVPKILLMGNEASGLPLNVQLACSKRVRLPMSGGTDSLNVAVAGAIFMHELTLGRTA